MSVFRRMGAPESVATVIPSWNSAALLPRCIASLQAEGSGAELLVVDNGSEDGSLEYLREHGVPHVSLPRNVGFAAAVDLGARRVAADAIFVLNVDTVVEPGCIATLAAALADSPRLGGVQPRILQLESTDAPGSPEPATVYSAGQALTAEGRALELGAGELEAAAHLRRRELFGVCGAACLLRRRLFTELGGYDESYFAFYEDVDLNVRAQIAGWSFAYVPEAVVWHVGNASWSVGFSRPSADNARLVARNRLATQVKFMPAAALPRIAVVEVGALLRAARQRRFLATLRGKLAVLPRLPRLLAERRRLRRGGDLGRARRWLGRGEGGDFPAGQEHRPAGG